MIVYAASRRWLFVQGAVLNVTSLRPLGIALVSIFDRIRRNFLLKLLKTAAKTIPGKVRQ
jgi:hypothetical protein